VQTVTLADHLEGARIVRRQIESGLAPTDALRACRDDLRPFGLVGHWAGGGALIGSEPVQLADPDHHDPFRTIAALPALPGPTGFVGGGWFGYLGYGLGRSIEHLPPPPPRPDPIPRFALAFYDHLLHWVEADRTWWFEALWTDERGDELDRRYEELRRRLSAPPEPSQSTWCGPFSAEPSRVDHMAAVAATLESIRAGDIYQANLCVRLEADIEGSMLDLFARGAEALAPAYGAFVGGPLVGGAPVELASFSPELFLRRAGSTVRSSPIKGTASRPADITAASLEHDQLERSAKDRAENVMIVDLVRNDLGRVCEFGSVHVPSLCAVESHPGLCHLVSTVRGRLRSGCGWPDVIEATFPPGSVTGAPKLAAIEHIHALEPVDRGLYCGAIGWVDADTHRGELNVAIRTFWFDDGRLHFGTGGAITWDSTPAGEWEETALKARRLVRVASAQPVGAAFGAS
jgi:para-aminobenzoate synthetase/4-amino-4-deoxychorismate lyase